ncbi:hypothetical protein HPP92_014421 [Vanilla planifolia]|uniref:Uncharacterized protein n=1 Tax=Vanilla planifolia TaxID=51239 RepID=A0A835QQX5_VANPL|nr:hypothetical protein HPP92_014421 [Vanilla planifolia]
MAISSASLLFPPPIRHRTAVLRCVSEERHTECALLSRRQALHIVVSSPAIVLARPGPAGAEDIPLFGIRKRLKKIEEEAVEVVNESEKVVEEGLAVAEKEVEAAAEEGLRQWPG